MNLLIKAWSQKQPIVVGQLPVLPPALIVTNEASAAAKVSLGQIEVTRTDLASEFIDQSTQRQPIVVGQLLVHSHPKKNCWENR